MKTSTLLSMVVASVMLWPATRTSAQEADFARGADVSWVTQQEAHGAKYFTTSGKEMELMQLLRDEYDINAIRLRVFVNPENGYSKEGYCGKDNVVGMAVRAKNLGMDVMIDFHYSDNWADPAKQHMPIAWQQLDKQHLLKAIKAHTTDVLRALKRNGVTPRWVQIGNEIRPGMLWSTDVSTSGGTQDEEGKYVKNVKNLADYINAGYQAAKRVFPKTVCMVHLDNGYDADMFRQWFDELQANGGKWDMIGMSLYPYWARERVADANEVVTLAINNINALAERYGCDVMIVETGMQVGDEKGGMASAEKLAEGRMLLKRIIDESLTNTGGHCRGVFYWEPEAAPQHYQLGAFDFDGVPTVVMDAFKR